ncbi:hypothetical protein BJY24_007141 [Nocardia transvalensis]|uniref:Uncharacterized protein n=1 Tax=Nocardia transvalensis TaxID=37333 RepID=A0A7W9UM42_9NOCA|nr:hypothetical protein [Nocardia transvalensis]MBB5918229.1 hypothetical protein [Nocardia transvalensis]
MDNLDLKQAVSDFDKAVVELLRASGWLYHVHRVAAQDPSATSEQLEYAESRLQGVSLQKGVFDHLYHEAA